MCKNTDFALLSIEERMRVLLGDVERGKYGMDRDVFRLGPSYEGLVESMLVAEPVIRDRIHDDGVLGWLETFKGVAEEGVGLTDGQIISFEEALRNCAVHDTTNVMKHAPRTATSSPSPSGNVRVHMPQAWRHA